MSLPDYEPGPLWVGTWHEARCTYRCTSCGRDIPSGAQYLRTRWMAEGEFGNSRQCIGCVWHVQAILDAYDDSHSRLLEPQPHDVREWVGELLEWYGKDSASPVVEALLAAREHLRVSLPHPSGPVW